MEGVDGRLLLMLVFSIGFLFSNVNSKGVKSNQGKGPPSKQDPGTVTYIPQLTTKPIVPTAVPATTSTPTVPSFVLSLNNKPCLKAKFYATFTIDYDSIQNGTTKPEMTTVSLPSSAKSSGICLSTNNTSGEFTLEWGNKYTFIIYFSQKQVNKGDMLSSNAEKWTVTMATKLVFRYNTSDNAIFKSPVKEQEVEASTQPSDKLFENPLNTSFTCNSATEYKLLDPANRSVTLKMWDVKIQLVNVPKDGFSESHLCAGDKKAPEQNIVPIAVAGCLAGVILLVILGYLITKRTHKPAYTTFDD